MSNHIKSIRNINTINNHKKRREELKEFIKQYKELLAEIIDQISSLQALKLDSKLMAKYKDFTSNTEDDTKEPVEGVK